MDIQSLEARFEGISVNDENQSTLPHHKSKVCCAYILTNDQNGQLTRTLRAHYRTLSQSPTSVPQQVQADSSSHSKSFHPQMQARALSIHLPLRQRQLPKSLFLHKSLSDPQTPSQGARILKPLLLLHSHRLRDNFTLACSRLASR